MKIIINLGQGNLSSGCDNIVVQLINPKRHYVRQFSGSLPPAPELAKVHRQWESGYHAFYQDKALRIGLLESEGMRYSESNFQKNCQQLPQQLNLWLSQDGFASIERALRTELDQDQSIQIIITAANLQLQQLPWHLWNFVNDYPQAVIAFSSLNWQEIQQPATTGAKVRILVVLGNSDGIDLQQDLESLKKLPEAELTVLTQPQLTELNEYLWQSRGWDILLFSGHSHSDAEAGYIHLNTAEGITIAQLKHSLAKAIANGLRIAIFNSCEGIGLALHLADLSLPYTVVMGQPVPDQIAQVFLQYFVQAFATGKTFTLAVKEAQQKLAGWETEYVCASWLPLIWQNPTVDSLAWHDLYLSSPRQKLLQSTKSNLICSLLVGSLVMLCRSLAWLEPVELGAYDRLLQRRSAETIDPRILVVEITEEDTNRDRYPLSDSILVEAIDLLEQHQPAAIGLDIHRSYGRDQGYQDLIQRFERSSRIFPVCSYGATNNSYAPPQELSEEKLIQQMGFSDLVVDDRSPRNSSRSDLTTEEQPQNPMPKVRRQLLSYDPSLTAVAYKCLTPYSLSFQLAFEYLQQAGTTPLAVNQKQQWQFGQVTVREMERRFSGYQQLDSKSSQIPINYRSGKPAKKFSLGQLRSGNIDPQLIKDRIILIGYTASVARDYFDTPYGIMPGVWIHAHMTSQLLSAVQDGRPLIWALPQWGEWLWVLSWLMVMVIILAVFNNQSVIYSVLGTVILIVIFDSICLFFLTQGAWLPYVPTILAILILNTIVITGRVVRLKSYS